MVDWLLTRAYVHARERGERCRDFEGLIARNGEASYFYALRILRGRFRRGEMAIARAPVWAVKYARFVRRGRFPMAEPFIARDPESCYEYFKYVMGGAALPEKMHLAMLLVSFEQPENRHVKKYFSEVTPGLDGRQGE